MRIALIHYRMMRSPGGLESRLKSYLREFSQRGHEVTLLMAQPRNLKVPEGVRLQRLPRGPLPKSLQPMAFNAWLGGWMRRHPYDFSFSLGRTSHQDMVLNPGNHLGFLRAEGSQPTTLSDWVQIRLDRLAYERSRIVLAASEMMKQETSELYGVPEAKVQVLLPPTDLSRFRPQPERRGDLRAQLGIQQHEVACAFVSASHARKGLDLLLHVFKALRDEPFKLLVAGNPPPPQASGLDNIIWLGHIDNPEDLYAACDLSLLPARYEPFGQVVSESVLCGVPAFVSDRVGAGYYLSKKEGNVLPWDAPEAWIEALRSFSPHHFSAGAAFGQKWKLGISEHVAQIMAAM